MHTVNGHRSAGILAAVVVLSIGLSACAISPESEVAPSASRVDDPIAPPTTAASSPTATPSASSMHKGILAYMPQNGITSMLLSVYDPATGDVSATHKYPFSILTFLDAHATGYARPSAGRAISSDLSMTLYYVDVEDGTSQLFVATDRGDTYPVSQAIDQSDSFSGAKSAKDGFFRGGDLYFSIAGKQYSVSERKLFDGSFTRADFRDSSVSVNSDGVTQADIIGDMKRDCEQYHGQSFVEGMGFLNDGRYVGFAQSKTNRNTLASYPVGCRYSAPIGQQDAKFLLPDTTQQILEAVVSPDGSQVAFVATQGTQATLYSVPAQGGTPQKITELPGPRIILAGWR